MPYIALDPTAADPGMGPARKPIIDARREHLRRAGRLGNAKRRVLSGDDASEFAAAVAVLTRLSAKYRFDAAADAAPSPSTPSKP